MGSSLEFSRKAMNVARISPILGMIHSEDIIKSNNVTQCGKTNNNSK